MELVQFTVCIEGGGKSPRGARQELQGGSFWMNGCGIKGTAVLIETGWEPNTRKDFGRKMKPISRKTCSQYACSPRFLSCTRIQKRKKKKPNHPSSTQPFCSPVRLLQDALWRLVASILHHPTRLHLLSPMLYRPIMFRQNLRRRMGVAIDC